MSIEFKGSHFERDVILWGVRWYVAYPISYRQLEEMMEERGVEVDHSTLNRWVLKYAPLLEQEFRARKCPVGRSWRMDETYVKVKGVWKYLYRAVDKAGATVDFLLTAKRDRKAALRFLRKAFGQHGTPEKITIDKSGANTAAIESYNAEHKAGIEIRQVKYLNNIVEQDHRAVKRLVRPMLSAFDYFRTTRAYLEQHGKPVAFYSDKHGIFRMNNKDAVGGDVVTQFGRALVALLLSTQDTVGRATTDSHRGVVTAKAVRRERPVACSIGMKSRSMPPPHVAAEIPVVDPPRNSAKNTKSEQPRVSQSL